MASKNDPNKRLAAKEKFYDEAGHEVKPVEYAGQGMWWRCEMGCLPQRKWKTRSTQ